VSQLSRAELRERAREMREAWLEKLRAGWFRKTPRTMQGRMVHFVPAHKVVCDAFVVNESRYYDLVKVMLFRPEGPAVAHVPRSMLQFKPHCQEAA
jgi:hypothetical protein